MSVTSDCGANIHKSLIVNSCNLQLGKTIGQGTWLIQQTGKTDYVVSICLSGEFGIVYKGMLKRSFSEGYSETVAVKTLKGKLQAKRISCLRGPLLLML